MEYGWVVGCCIENLSPAGVYRENDFVRRKEVTIPAASFLTPLEKVPGCTPIGFPQLRGLTTLRSTWPLEVLSTVAQNLPARLPGVPVHLPLVGFGLSAPPHSCLPHPLNHEPFFKSLSRGWSKLFLTCC